MGYHMELNNKKETDIRTVDKSLLSELCSIRIKRTAEDQVDWEDLQSQTADIYCYRVGEIAVAFEYGKNGRTIDELFSLMVQASF